jgi:hypothetical protein
MRQNPTAGLVASAGSATQAAAHGGVAESAEIKRGLLRRWSIAIPSTCDLIASDSELRFSNLEALV